MNGIAWFLPDESLAHVFEVLYDWAAEGSKLFISDGDTERITSSTENVLVFYKTPTRFCLLLSNILTRTTMVFSPDTSMNGNHSYTPDLAVGKGTILVAEDNPQVLGRIVRALEESGYSVIAIYEKKGTNIDLVILDMLMPHVGGRDYYQTL